jgi:1,4-alpha-glucan branching enzyme
MLRKSNSKDGKICRVTFTLPPETGARSAAVCGEFNDWNEERHQLKVRKDGRFSTSVSLRPGRSYRFRYLLDGRRWENDPQADAFLPNPFGTTDSVIAL